MANFCLSKEFVNKFIQGLKSGEIDPEKLAKFPDSISRREYLAKFVGDENAKGVNALFESKLMLKNQKAGMITWAKKVGGLTKDAKKNLIEKINKLNDGYIDPEKVVEKYKETFGEVPSDKINISYMQKKLVDNGINIEDLKSYLLNPKEADKFYNDLADTKLGVNVTQKEAETIAKLSSEIQANSGLKANGNHVDGYGTKVVELRNFMGKLKQETQKVSITNPLAKGKNIIMGTLGTSKALKFSLDFSSLLHQGFVAATTHPFIWAKSAINAIGRAIEQAGTGRHVMDKIDASIINRKNYDNYVKMGLDIHTPEDWQPSSIPERIPLYGRVYKMAEVGFTGFLHILRANLADNELRIAEKHNINLNDPAQLKSLGKVINSATGRGALGVFEKVGSEVNLAFASLRQLKGQFDVLTAHTLDTKLTGYARKRAAQQLVKVVGAQAAIMGAFAVMWPGSIEWNSTSSDFGKVRNGNQRWDISGGESSLVVLAARLLTMSEKSSTTGNVTQLNSGKFGAPTGMDIFDNFFQNRYSPVAALFRDYLKGQDFQGNKFDLTNEVKNMLLPLGADALNQLKNDPKANLILGTIGNEIGLFSTDYLPKSQQTKTTDWGVSQSKTLTQFHQQVGDQKFQDANQKFNQQYKDWQTKTQNSQSFKDMTPAQQSALLTKGKTIVEKNVLKDYNFTYKRAPRSSSSSDLLPK